MCCEECSRLSGRAELDSNSRILLAYYFVELRPGGRGIGSSARRQANRHPTEIPVGNMQLYSEKVGSKENGERDGGEQEDTTFSLITFVRTEAVHEVPKFRVPGSLCRSSALIPAVRMLT